MLLDACRFILEDRGEAQSSYWLASQVVETRLWRASESQVRRALNGDKVRYDGETCPAGEGLRGVKFFATSRQRLQAVAERMSLSRVPKVGGCPAG